LKVIGAGFGRTGTLSLKTALERLGFGPCYHMIEVLKRPRDAAFWDEAADKAARGERVNWDRVFSDYEATVDWPGCAFYRELMEAYPDAKVILSVRDPQEWYESVRATFLRGRDTAAPKPSLRRTLVFKVLRWVAPPMRNLYLMQRKVIFERSFRGHWLERGDAIEAFEEHVKEVKEFVPPERLLVYEVALGWEPLCEFLGVEVPDEPFPHRNDAEEFRRIAMKRQMAATLAPMARAVAVLVSLVLAALLLHSEYRRRAGVSRCLV
jgi:Sulfotransferase domain